MKSIRSSTDTLRIIEEAGNSTKQLFGNESIGVNEDEPFAPAGRCSAVPGATNVPHGLLDDVRPMSPAVSRADA